MGKGLGGYRPEQWGKQPCASEDAGENLVIDTGRAEAKINF